MLVVPALVFVAHYLLAMLVCGAAVWRLTVGRGVETGQSADDRRRLTIAAFLIGTALAPFLIGCIQGVLWLSIRHQPLWLYAGFQTAWVLAGLVICRAWLRECLRQVLDASRATPLSRLASLALLVVLGFVSAHAGFHALSPQRHYDASTYALDARRLAEHRSWGGLMAHEARDDTNQFANHNHGSSYQSFLSASLIYGRNPQQDFPLRVAQRILGVHCVVVLIGLGLRVGWAAAVLAPMLLLGYVYFSTLAAAASRDFYRLLPFMFIVGMFRLGGWPRFNAQGALISLGFCFLWNAHASSLMIAPTLLGCMILLCLPRPASVIALLAGFAVSVPLGALRLVRSWQETGDPLHFSPMHNMNYLGTQIIGPWMEARGTNPSGIAHAGERFAGQFVRDGGLIVGLLWASLAVFLFWSAVNLLRRRALADPMLLLIGGYLLFSMLMLAGAFDALSERLSMTFSMNARYRAHLYPIAAVLAAYVAWELIRPRLARVSARAAGVFLLCNLGAMLLLAGQTWEGHRMGLFVDTTRANAHLADNVPYYRWASALNVLDRRETVLMDYAYLGWYQTRSRILFTQDPRLRDAFTATTPQQAIDVLDAFDVRYVYMINLERTAILESGVALGKVLQSPAFELIMSEKDGAWYLYRRVAAEPEATAPSSAPASPAAGALGP